VRLEKPANLLALAESWFGYAQSEKSFAVVALDQTASLGLWVESDLHRGASTLGPTFGHVKVSGTGRTCDCGQIDCLNAYFSHAAMRRDGAARLGEGFAASALARTDIVAALAEACDAGAPGARELIDEQGARLGMAVSHVVNLINPEKIIVALESARYSALVAPALKAAVEANSFRAHFAATQLIFHTLDEQLWARGAAALMLRDVYSAPWTSAYQEEKK
jgi:predicted NBD/HSP70 family sugar kinase